MRVLLVTLLLTGCGAQRVYLGHHDDEWLLSEPLDRVHVDASVGSIEIRGAPSQRLVQLEVEAWGHPRGEEVGDLIVTRFRDGQLYIGPRDHEWTWEHGIDSFRFVVSVPEGIAVRATIGGGEVAVELERVRGVWMEAGVGDLSLRVLEELEGPVHLETGVGDVFLRLPDDPRLKIHGETGVGSIAVSPGHSLSLEHYLVAAEVSGSLGEDGASCHVETGVGDIHID